MGGVEGCGGLGGGHTGLKQLGAAQLPTHTQFAVVAQLTAQAQHTSTTVQSKP